MAKFTQQAIVYSFLKLLNEKSIDKITVKDICEVCEINRNTFYYYFSDIYQVLEALISSDTDATLKDNKKATSFYDEYIKKYHLVIDNRKAVYHLYNSKNRDMILNYFYTITENFVEKYVIEEAKGTNLTTEDIRFITEFYSNSMIGNTLRWLQNGMKEDQEELIHKMSLSYHATISALIKSIEDERHT